jgi:hypothetical protein
MINAVILSGSVSGSCVRVTDVQRQVFGGPWGECNGSVLSGGRGAILSIRDDQAGAGGLGYWRTSRNPIGAG